MQWGLFSPLPFFGDVGITVQAARLTMGDVHLYFLKNTRPAPETSLLNRTVISTQESDLLKLQEYSPDLLHCSTADQGCIVTREGI